MDSNITTELNATSNHYFGLNLYVNVYKTKHEFLYDFVAMPLSENERHLDGGRFINFSQNRFTNDISIKIDYHSTYHMPDQRYGLIETNGLLSSYVDWIFENCHGKWNLAILLFSVNIISYIFSFESESDAMYFVLRWK